MGRRNVKWAVGRVNDAVPVGMRLFLFGNYKCRDNGVINLDLDIHSK